MADPLEKPPEQETDLAKDQDERILFCFVKDAPRMPGASGLGAATSTLRPWPHQSKVADTVISRYPEGSCCAMKSVLARPSRRGLILRQLLLDGRVRRALILAPKSVSKQFQEELFEKFVLDVPIFDGKVFRNADRSEKPPTTPNPWDSLDLYMASSQLAKRRERRDEILSANPSTCLSLTRG